MEQSIVDERNFNRCEIIYKRGTEVQLELT